MLRKTNFERVEQNGVQVSVQAVKNVPSCLKSKKQKGKKRDKLTRLPDEILLKIFHYLSLNDIANLKLVSKRFNVLANSVLDDRVRFWDRLLNTVFVSGKVEGEKEIFQTKAKDILCYEKKRYSKLLDVEKGFQQLRGGVKVDGLRDLRHNIIEVMFLDSVEKGLSEAKVVFQARKIFRASILMYPLICPIAVAIAPFWSAIISGKNLVLDIRRQATNRKKIIKVAKGVPLMMINIIMSPLIAPFYPAIIEGKYMSKKHAFKEKFTGNGSLQAIYSQLLEDKAKFFEKDALISFGIATYQLNEEMIHARDDLEKSKTEEKFDELSSSFKSIYGELPPMRSDLALKLK